MEVAGGLLAPELQQKQQVHGGALVAQPPVKVAEPLNPALQQQLNLESVRTRAQGLYKTVSRILEDFDAVGRTNALPKWQDVLGQFSMVNLELFNIVEDIKKVSKAFVIHPKNVNAENAPILPVMLSSKLLPEMEVEDTAKREKLLHGMQNLPIPMQIEKLKARIEMIGMAVDSAEKVISDARKTYNLGSRQLSTLTPTIDKAQAAKTLEQENFLRAAINHGEGLRLPVDQRHPSSLSSLPVHLVNVIPTSDGAHGFGDASGAYPKSSQASFNPGNVNSQGGTMQISGNQFPGRSVPSPGLSPFDNVSTPPLAHTNSPKSSSNMMNTPSPQQQTPQQRQKIMQVPQHQQQLRQSPVNSIQLHDLQGQAQQKFQQAPGQSLMQYAQTQFHNRPIVSGHMQHNVAQQTQVSQSNQLRSHLGQFSGPNNNNLYNPAQTSQNPQISQTLLHRAQNGYPGGLNQRDLLFQMINDQPMYTMGGSNPRGMVTMQQQQQQQHSISMNPNQSLQSGLVGLQNTAQNSQSYSQPRQQGQPQ